MTSIEKGLVEGIAWMTVAVVSSVLNASALRGLGRKFGWRKVHRLYLINVFICNLTMGSVIYICFMFIKFDFQACALRDSCFVGIIVLTNVNQLSMICVLTAHMSNCLRSAFNAQESSRVAVSSVLHSAAVLGSWLFSIVIVLVLVYKPQTNVILIYTICKTVCIFALDIYAINYIRKGINLRRQSDANRSKDAIVGNTAITVMTAFLAITVVTWVPLIIVLSLQKFEIVPKKDLAMPLLVTARLICIGPMIDPIFYFWSKKTNKVSSNGRTTRKKAIEMKSGEFAG